MESFSQKVIRHKPGSSEGAPVEESVTEPTIGDFLDLVVVSWRTEDPHRRGRGGIGLARPLGTSHGSRDGLGFREADIVSEGIETLRSGSRILGRVSEPFGNGHRFSVTEIEIYI